MDDVLAIPILSNQQSFEYSMCFAFPSASKAFTVQLIMDAEECQVKVGFGRVLDAKGNLSGRTTEIYRAVSL